MVTTDTENNTSPEVDDSTLTTNTSESVILTPYEKLTQIHDAKFSNDVALEKRVGLYRFCGTIGKGNFSQVKSAVHLLTKDKVAIKIVDRSRLDRRNILMLSREVATLECVQHPHILRLFEVVETLGRVHLVTEWVRGGELYYRIVQQGTFPEDKAAKIFKQLLLAVQHMHILGYVHRDIKAENVLVITDDHVKLADFGFSTQIVTSQYLNTFCGSPPYAAPELFSDDHYLGGPVDVWALGVLIYFILVGNMPFRAPTVPQLRASVLKGEYRIPGNLSSSCVKMIQCILLHMPLHRPKVDQILHSEWLQNNLRPKKFSESEFDEAKSIIRTRKKSFWHHSSTKSRTTTPSPQKQSSANSDQKKIENYIECYTKKFNNVPVETFKNPIEKVSPTSSATTSNSITIPNHTTIIPISNNLNRKLLRNNSLINSSKIVVNKAFSKKIGPKDILNSHEIIQVKNAQATTSRPRNMERSYSQIVEEDEESLKSATDREFEKYVMFPTKTNGDETRLISLPPLEIETREILKMYGIDWLMLEKSIDNGPRSDIIGIYRIVITRLQEKQLKQLSLESGFNSPSHTTYNFNANGKHSVTEQFSSNNKTLLKPKKNPTKINCAIL